MLLGRNLELTSPDLPLFLTGYDGSGILPVQKMIGAKLFCLGHTDLYDLQVSKLKFLHTPQSFSYGFQGSQIDDHPHPGIFLQEYFKDFLYISPAASDKGMGRSRQGKAGQAWPPMMVKDLLATLIMNQDEKLGVFKLLLMIQDQLLVHVIIPGFLFAPGGKGRENENDE